MEEGRKRQRPTAAEVIAKLKDDGDFDSLRLKIIRKVKENEELRNSIIAEVKQSEILNQDGSENLKLRQLSDAIYQELGKKIMGQISDEVWKVIRNDSTKDGIRGTVESVYNRIVNPKAKEEDLHSSPAKDNASKQNGISSAPASAEEANMCDESEPQMPPGFSQCDQHQEQILHLPSEEDLHKPTNMVDDDMPPGFVTTVSPGINKLGDVDAADVPPGFGTGGGDDVDMPSGFSNGVGVGSGAVMPPGFGMSGAMIGGDDDDPDVPPGFG